MSDAFEKLGAVYHDDSNDPFSSLGAVYQDQSKNNSNNPSFLSKLGGYTEDSLHQVANQLRYLGAGIGNASVKLGNDITGNSSKNPNVDVAKQFGLDSPNYTDNFYQQLGEYLPYALVGEGALATKLGSKAISESPMLAKLAISALSGGTYGATQSNPGSRLNNAVNDAALAPAFDLAGTGAGKIASSAVNGLSKIPGSLKESLSKYITPSLSKDISKDFSITKDIDNSQAFDMAKNNYDKYSDKESKAWDSVNNQSKLVDLMGIKFDDSNHIENLKNKLDEINKKSISQSGDERAYKDAPSLLKGYINDQHGTFSDAIAHNKALNQDYKNQIDPGRSLPFDIVNYAKKSIKQTFDKNLEDNGLKNTLGQSWRDANQATSDKNKIFHEITNNNANTQYSKFSKYIKGDGNYSDPSNFVLDYVPKSSADGISKMEQFSKMIGDDDYAKNILKKNYFKDTFNENGFNSNSFLNRYNNLSDSQRSYLFSPSQNTTVKSLSKIVQKNPGILNQSNKNTMLSSALSAVLGTAGGGALGHPYVGAGVATALSPLIQSGINKTFENPSIKKYFMDYLNSDKNIAPKFNGKLSNLLSRGISTGVTSKKVNS